jgi:hypothetical protein
MYDDAYREAGPALQLAGVLMLLALALYVPMRLRRWLRS